MKRIPVILLFIMLWCAAAAWAAPVDQETARVVAENWLRHSVETYGSWGGSTTPEIVGQETLDRLDRTVGYNFLVSPKGHIVVAGRDDLPPVRLYSDTTTLSARNGGDVAEWVAEDLFNLGDDLDRNRVEQMTADGAPVNARLWGLLSGGRVAFTFPRETLSGASEALSVGPLLTTAWSQGNPYNLQTPLWYDGQRTLTGCVATAAAQIMNYWHWPTTGQGSTSYTWNNGSINTTVSRDFGASTYDWANMLNSYSGGETAAQKDAVAKIMADAGIAWHMAYGVSGSGADTMYGATVYPTYFKYKNTIQTVYRTSYASASAWYQVFKTETQAGRVSQLRIRSSAGGHSVVVDGYRDSPSETLHINLGWGGSYDGWYTSDNFTTGSYNWNETNYQGAIINIEPNIALPVSLAQALDQPTWTFATGETYSWTGQSTTTHDGADAGQSAAIPDNTLTYVGTTRTFTDGDVRFWWKVSSEAGWDYLTFYIDNVQQAAISGEVGWQYKTFPITAGEHTLRWEYSKDSICCSGGSDAAWVDQVVFTAGGGGGGVNPADLDGDGLADQAVYYPANGTWYVKGSAGTNLTKNWGWNATIPVPADYDADGKNDLAVYYPANGTWYVKGSAGTNLTKNWGWSATIPVPGDWDNDGNVDLAVYYPANGTWYVKGSAGTNLTKNWGWAATTPVPGDYDGDGALDLAVYYQVNGTWYIKGSAGANITQNWGWNAAMPAQADWDGDGTTDLAVYYPANGNWYIKGSSSGNATYNWGWSGAWPVAADWDFDSAIDVGVYYPVSGRWFLKGSSGSSTANNWGWLGANPVLPQYQINRQVGFISDPAYSFVGTWLITFDWGCNGTTGNTTVTVNTDGTWSGGGSSGTWSQNGNAVGLYFSNGTVYTGTMLGNSSITGTMVDYNGVSGCWTGAR